MPTKIRLRRGTATSWNTAQTAAGSTPLLAQGEIGYETNTGYFKIGDGTTLWGALPYADSGARTPTQFNLTFDSTLSATSSTFNGSTAVTVGLPENSTTNAATATKLKTARTINGASFDGTANIISGSVVYGTAATSGASFRTIYAAPASGGGPTSPVNGDVWISW